MLTRPAVALLKARAAEDAAVAQPAGRTREIAVATAGWLEGEALIRLSRLAEARPIVEAALAAAGKYGTGSKLHGDLLRARGNLNKSSGNAQAALADFQHGYESYRIAGEARGQAMALQDIGGLYIDAGDYPRVLRYFQQSAEAFAGDPALLVTGYNNRGVALRALGRLPQAETAFRRGLVIAREVGSAALEESILENLAAVQVGAGNLGEAERSLDRAFELTRTLGSQGSSPALWGVAAQAALKRGDLDEAEISIRRTFGMPGAAEDIGLREFHQTAALIYKRLGKDGDALTHLELFKSQDDRARAIAASTASQLMAARFDFANQDLKIARLNADRVRRDAASAASAARFQRTIFIGLLSASGIVVALLLAGFFSIRRSRNKVAAANANLSDANAQLEKALKAKTEFLATTSHEIRTPLNGILGMTQVILADRSVDPVLTEKVKLVHGAGETMRALIDDILDVAKMETGNLVLHREPMDLHRLLDEAARLWSGEGQRKGIQVRADVDRAPRHIVEDETRLRQVVFNLMSNAVKFTREGEVTLHVRTEQVGDGEQLIVCVSDSGIGIPTEKFEEIFESFRQVDGGTTRQFGGTGLGLTICRNIAQALGGTINVESHLGSGSTFTIRLPLVRAVVEIDDSDGVLLIEANPLARSMLKAVLARDYSRVIAVEDVAAAIEALVTGGIGRVLLDGGTIASEEDPPSLIAVVVAAAGARPVTMTVADLQPENQRLLSELGVAVVLAKPIAAPVLLAALRAAGTRQSVAA